MIPFLTFAKNCFQSLYQEKDDSTPNFCNDSMQKKWCLMAHASGICYRASDFYSKLK